LLPHHRVTVEKVIREFVPFSLCYELRFNLQSKNIKPSLLVPNCSANLKPRLSFAGISKNAKLGNLQKINLCEPSLFFFLPHYLVAFKKLNENHNGKRMALILLSEKSLGNIYAGKYRNRRKGRRPGGR
jgi:hypothetical protein